MLKELLEQYEEKMSTNKFAATLIIEKIHQYKTAAEKLEKRAEKKMLAAEQQKDKLRKIPVIDWKDEVVVPLAEEMGKRLGKHPVVLGPFGLGAEVTISLVDNPNIRRLEQDCLEITLEPDFEDGRLVLCYETGETYDDEYPPNSLGAMNGLNNVTARLPDSINEIMGLLKERPAIKPIL